MHARNAADTLHSTVRSFLPSRAVVVRTGLAVAFLAASAGSAHAQSAPAPLAPLRQAWDGGDFDRVPALAKKALDSGGLSRFDVVEAYSRLGASLAIAGNSRAAVAAFRRAALVDPDFRVPPEAGKRAAALAEQARRAQKKAGALALSLDTPGKVDAGSVIGVDVTLSTGREAAVTSITLDATDTLTARTYEQRTAGTARAHFEVPARMAMPDASLLVRVHARDIHDNELAEAEQRVHVAAAAPPEAAGPLATRDDIGRPRRSEKESHTSGGFWSSPWPYIIGGAALAAGGAATTWVLTRSTDNVDVGAVRVQLAH